MADVSPVMGATVQSVGMPARFSFMASNAGLAMGKWPHAVRRAASAPTEIPRAIFLLIITERLDWIELSCAAGREEAKDKADGGRRPQRRGNDDRGNHHWRSADLCVAEDAYPPDRHAD